MPLTNSPSFDKSVEPPKATRTRKVLSPLRVLILCLALVVILLGAVTFVLPDYGDVRGTIRDLDGNPLQAEVFVIGVPVTTRTDGGGRFAILNVPSGQQMLTIRYRASDISFQIDVPEQSSLNIGQIQVDTSA